MVIDLSIARKCIELLYNCTCSVETLVDREDAKTGITTQEWAQVLGDIPCKRSTKNIVPAEINNDVAEIRQEIKLFLAPEVIIAPGSRIKVKDVHGIEEYYKNTGKPAVYYNHQEIMLESVQRWA